MSRYVDMDKVYETARKYHKDFAESIADLTSLREVLEDTPTADVVEVVRCKDCKYYQDNNNWYPHNECKWHQDETPDADDFCSCGERKMKNE